MRRARPPLSPGDPGKAMLTEISPGHWSARDVRDTFGRRRDGTSVSPSVLRAVWSRTAPDNVPSRPCCAPLHLSALISTKHCPIRRQSKSCGGTIATTSFR